MLVDGAPTKPSRRARRRASRSTGKPAGGRRPGRTRGRRARGALRGRRHPRPRQAGRADRPPRRRPRHRHARPPPARPLPRDRRRRRPRPPRHRPPPGPRHQRRHGGRPHRRRLPPPGRAPSPPRKVDKRYLAISTASRPPAGDGRRADRPPPDAAQGDDGPRRTAGPRAPATARSPPTPAVSLVELDLLTGRTHQIRVHLKNLGHPLVGDPVYGEARWKAAAGAGPGRAARLPPARAPRLAAGLRHPRAPRAGSRRRCRRTCGSLARAVAERTSTLAPSRRRGRARPGLRTDRGSNRHGPVGPLATASRARQLPPTAAA